MVKKVYNRSALGTLNDLTATDTSPRYKLGEIVEVIDLDSSTDNSTKNNIISKYIYIKANVALTQYQPYQLDYSQTLNAEYITQTPLTLNLLATIIVPQIAIALDEYGWALLKGVGQVLVTAETYEIGDIMECLNGATALNVDADQYLSPRSLAIMKEDGTTAVNRAVFLLGKRVSISSS